ncbi:hypothetical protein [Phyllobacterium sp. YR531]|nr:hypothetical protein [Phyllobacterium sp. YR531]EJN04932.1 hypothetical protein PMI41_01398 [Phyllobacterium sp. YR531]
MSLIEANSCETMPVKQEKFIRSDRLTGLLIFAGAVVFHLAVIFNLLPSA